MTSWTITSTEGVSGPSGWERRAVLPSFTATSQPCGIAGRCQKRRELRGRPRGLTLHDVAVSVEGQGD